MEKRVIKHISVGAVAKNLWLVYFGLGFVVGIGSYVYLKLNPAALAPRITLWEWALAILLYAIIFCAILTVLSILFTVFYNILSRKMGGISIKIDKKEEQQQSEQQI